MKIKTIVLLLFCLPLFYACISGGKQNNIENTHKTDSLCVLDIEKSIGTYSDDAFKLNSIIDSVSFIPLETTDDESIVPTVNYTFAAIDTSFYISGGIINENGIFQFDASGNYLGKVIRTGMGPHEVPYSLAWGINKTLQTISIVANAKMVVYNLKTLDYYDIFSNEIQYPKFASLKDETFVFAKTMTNAPEMPYLKFLNMNGEVIKEVNYLEDRDVCYTTREGNYASLPFESYIVSSNYRDEVLFQDVFNDTISLIKDGNNMDRYIVLNRGKFMPKVEDISNDRKKAEQIYFRNMTETEDYFLLKYFYQNSLYTDIWDKSTRKPVSRVKTTTDFEWLLSKFNARYILPDGKETILDIVYADEKRLYALLDASLAINFVDGVIDEDANPVVMVLYLK